MDGLVLGIILMQVNRRHLMQDAAAAPGSGYQALQAWSSPAHSTATRSPQPFYPPPLFKAMLPSEPNPPDSSLVHTGLLSGVGVSVSVAVSG